MPQYTIITPPWWQLMPMAREPRECDDEHYREMKEVIMFIEVFLPEAIKLYQEETKEIKLPRISFGIDQGKKLCALWNEGTVRILFDLSELVVTVEVLRDCLKAKLDLMNR